MVKKAVKVYLDNQTMTLLKQKAEQLGYVGRGWLSHFLEKISVEDLVFLDGNVKALLKVLDLK